MDAGGDDAMAAVPESTTGLVLDDLVKFEPTKGGGHGDRGLVFYHLDDDNRPEAGKLPVICVDGAVVYVGEADLALADRSYIQPGEIVVSASDPGGQIGVVTGVATALDLIQLNGGGEPVVEVARGVSPAELRRVRELSIGDYVVHGPWLGRVVEVPVEVDVVFADGAACRVAGPDDKLAIRSGRARQVTNTLFQPGQRVLPRLDCPSAFRSARWLNGSRWHRSHAEGTVARVEMAAALVYWVASSELGTKPEVIKAAAPPAWQQNPRDDLAFFSSTRECSWAAGDHCYFRRAADDDEPVKPQEMIGEESQHGKQQAAVRKARFKLGRRERQRRGDHVVEIGERPMTVSETCTTADVLWQDGTRQRGMPSASLVAFEVLNGNEFFPGERVKSRSSIDDDGDEGSAGANEKDEEIARANAGADANDAGDDEEADGPAAARYGVVRSLDVRDQTVRVSWFKAGARGREMECDETVSAYDLDLDYDHIVFYGDVVVRQRPSSELATSDGDAGGSTRPSSEATTDAGDVSWVGHVIDLCDDGRVQVKWADGTTSKVLPHEISAVEEKSVDEMMEEMGDWVANDAVDESEEDTDEEVDHAAAAAGDVTVENECNDEDSTDESVGEAGAAAVRPTTIMGQASGVMEGLFRLASEVWSKGRRFLVRHPEATTPSSESAAMENAQPSNNGDGYETTLVDEDDADGNVCEEKEKAAAGVATRGDDSFRFPQFDVLQTVPPDHHFLKDTEQGIDGGKKWFKRVQKEWKILENDLPDTIYVRAFEDRMDLLRVAMVGAVGTPYQDGLFFFDLQLPMTYPAVPPQVNYRSFGLRLNPNLYESGTVCLSLLDTFGGEGVELWSPATSSILQLVVSIQGLVLTSQPFFNEPAFEEHFHTPNGARNEVIYAEDACLLSLKTMLHLLRRPPAGFEDLVRDHFRRRGRFVLRACEAYLHKGCPVGTLDDAANATGLSSGRTCSAGFQLALARFMPRLVEVFIAIGADGCERFEAITQN